MPKTNRTYNSKAGSRGGTSYWTNYRRSRESELPLEDISVANNTVFHTDPAEEEIIENESSLDKYACEQVSSSSEDELAGALVHTVNTVYDDEEYEIFPIMSSEEDDNDTDDNESSRSQSLDKRASQIFKNLVLRNPHLSNIFVNDMLSCLKEIGVDVPKDHRTLLGTPNKNVALRVVEPGVYWHFGLKRLIDKLLENGIDLPTNLTIMVNMDGMPLSNSSKANCWPILVNIYDLKVNKPFVLGIYFHERSKPDCSNVYLKEYVEDLKVFKTTGYRGIFIKKVIYPLDAPALAFIKKVQGHTGKSACNKCTIVGKYKSGRVCFPSISNPKRHDTIFRERSAYEHHHKSDEPGPLEDRNLGTDMVRDFPIEPLHARDLGVMKKLMLCWTGHKRYGSTNHSSRNKLKLSDNQLRNLDDHLQLIRIEQPSEYNRPSRRITIVKFWKGAEFSCVVHCTGPVVFKGVLPKIIYDNFLLLHVASHSPHSILCYLNFIKVGVFKLLRSDWYCICC